MNKNPLSKNYNNVIKAINEVQSHLNSIKKTIGMGIDSENGKIMGFVPYINRRFGVCVPP